MTTQNTVTHSSALATLEQHKKRLEALTSRRTQAQVRIEASRQQYAQLCEQARSQFGTADLPELRALLRRKTEENETLVAQFVASLDTAEEHIARVEQALADPAALEELLQALPQEKAAPVAEAPASAHSAPVDDLDL